MSVLADSVYAIIAIQIKKRHDSLLDQYHRLLMVKLCILCSLVIGFNFFSDKVTCIIANNQDDEDEQYASFVGSACWVQGFYIFEEMTSRFDESSYYGIPENVDLDGVNARGRLCSTLHHTFDTVDTCQPMSKRFYLQYQYMPFYTASLAFLFYTPYIMFKLINCDMANLRTALKKEGKSPKDLYRGFFVYDVNSRAHMRKRYIVNIVIKVLYICAHAVAFATTDVILYENFATYGFDYAGWIKQDGPYMHDPDLKLRKNPKPANMLLPPMGFCDIHEVTSDLRNTYINSHRYLCEISQHILYQYVMLLLWALLVIGMCISVAGFIIHLMTCCRKCVTLHRRGDGHLFRMLTLREIDYLDYILEKSKEKYKGVVKILGEARSHDGKYYDDEHEREQSVDGETDSYI